MSKNLPAWEPNPERVFRDIKTLSTQLRNLQISASTVGSRGMVGALGLDMLIGVIY
jgi:hypothetical protein